MVKRALKKLLAPVVREVLKEESVKNSKEAKTKFVQALKDTLRAVDDIFQEVSSSS